MTSNDLTAAASGRANDEDEAAIAAFQRFCLELQRLEIVGRLERTGATSQNQDASTTTQEP